MLLGIAAELSAPPSSPSVFRDVTLFGRVFRHYDVVAYVDHAEELDSYATWFKRYGLFDYVDELVVRREIDQFSIEIQGGRDARLTAHSLADMIRVLRAL